MTSRTRLLQRRFFNLTLAIIISFTFSCMLREKEPFIPDDVESVLNKAGQNQAELLKVIRYFGKEKDTEKLKAAYFLIGSMNYLYHTEGKGWYEYQKNFYKMDSLIRSGNGIFNHSWDSLQKIFPEQNITNQHILDAKSLKAELLIDHINSAFKARNYTWAKSLSFSDFCEYVLPYKLLNEKPEAWMSTVQRKYAPFVKQWNKTSDPLIICKQINKDLKQLFYINARFACSVDLGYTDLIKTRTGRCAHATQLTAYTMRALGLPVVMDFTPHWGNKNFSHQWNALLINGKTYHFVGSESDPGNDKIMFTRSYWIKRRRAKVFRYTFSVQKNSLALQVENPDSIPKEFRNPYMKDVTEDYVPVKDIRLKLNNKIKKAEFAYICVFSDQKWQPVHWGKINWFNLVTFSKMERGVVYMPAYYSRGELVPAGPAFLLETSGNIRYMTTDTQQLENIIAKKKYPEEKSNQITAGEEYELFFWEDNWKTLGIRKASADSVVFNRTPKGALLMIKNINKGKQERIFTYEKGEQQWW